MVSNKKIAMYAGFGLSGTVVFLVLIFVFVLIFSFSDEKAVANEGMQPAAGIEVSTPNPIESCAPFAQWIGKPVDETAIAASGRNYRILSPGSQATTDYRQDRINILLDEQGTVVQVTCG